MSKWTPEPWYAHGAFIVSDQGGTDERVNIYDMDPSNRERIVACVNACTGLNPGAIPALVAVAQNAVDAGAIDEIHLSLVRDALAAVKGTQQ